MASEKKGYWLPTSFLQWNRRWRVGNGIELYCEEQGHGYV